MTILRRASIRLLEVNTRKYKRFLTVLNSQGFCCFWPSLIGRSYERLWDDIAGVGLLGCGLESGSSCRDDAWLGVGLVGGRWNQLHGVKVEQAITCLCLSSHCMCIS